MKRIKIDRDKCVGCLTCTTACIVAHDSEDTRSRITVDSAGKYAPIFCRHCDRPECVYTCMTGAMSKNKETGLVEYNKDHCASCYMCIMACPYGVLKADSRMHKEIMKCDACKEHGTAQCVAKCPMRAITLEEVTE
ncbi:MAG: 4Fe-4S dicluster domain-containing protein [Clostridium celatum]|nr:4Fe-4S dicluster domain-containing protein [Clostridium celatum]